MSNANIQSSVPPPSQAHLDRGYGASSIPQRSNLDPAADTHTADFGRSPTGAEPPADSSLLSASAQQNHGRFNEEWDASQRGSSIIDGHIHRSNSVMSQGDTLIPSRGGTLKKKASLRRVGSTKRSSSRRSSRAGSVRSLALQPAGDGTADEAHSAFVSPVPTSGNPTEILSNRFQAWRKVLKDLITYFREIQASYDQRSKSLLKLSNVINNTSTSLMFLPSGGIDEALQILRNYHKAAIAEANKSRDIESDVILALTGLRSDLNQKIKEIKSLSGDFKNSVDKEMESTRKAVNSLQDGLGQADVDPGQMTGKQDPYLLKLATDRQIEKQIDEENYLHQAYLNLEASGRELESIVVGEIQKSYNAYAGILKREADGAYNTVEELRTGPIAMPKDHEWNEFVVKDEHFVDPKISVRLAHNIQYPGRDNYLAQAIREGLLERKSKYLKSYTPGWYVLSPTHLHEFKSADKSQAPIMSLYLPEQKLGSHSAEGSSSNKFMLKGRQTGSMHRGHSWVFRAESYETMLSWIEDIRTLTEKSPQERNAFVRQHARSVSGTSQKAGSISSDGNMDEEDEEPFSAAASSVVAAEPKYDARRPQPGGRFPSDLQVNTQRGLQIPLSLSSGSSNFGDVQDPDVAAASALPGSGVGQHYAEGPASPSRVSMVHQYAMEDGVNPYTNQPIDNGIKDDGNRLAPMAVAVGGAAIGVTGLEAYQNRDQVKNENMTNQYFPKQQAVLEVSTNAAPDTHLRPSERAAMESSMIAAPDTYAQLSEKRAAHEAQLIAAPDAQITPATSSFISGGTNQGDLSGDFVLSNINYLEAGEGIESNRIKTAMQPLTDELARPALAAGQNQQSAQSISQLHIPGEYPRPNAGPLSSTSSQLPI